MQQRRYWGLIDYTQYDGLNIGREWFNVTVAPDGARTVRALCQLDDREIQRDVIYSVDGAWRPLDAAVRLSVADRFQGSSWFYFSDDHLECEGMTAQLGRFSQSIQVQRRPDIFAPHPLICDGWQAAAFAKGGPAVQHFLSSHCSPNLHGGSGPMAGVTGKKLEYLGEQSLTVAAGEFTASHFMIHPEEDEAKGFPLEFWVHGEDRLLIKLRWDLLKAEYTLREYAQD
jgi:hypothetical protein